MSIKKFFKNTYLGNFLYDYKTIDNTVLPGQCFYIKQTDGKITHVNRNKTTCYLVRFNCTNVVDNDFAYYEQNNIVVVFMYEYEGELYWVTCNHLYDVYGKPFNDFNDNSDDVYQVIDELDEYEDNLIIYHSENRYYFPMFNGLGFSEKVNYSNKPITVYKNSDDKVISWFDIKDVYEELIPNPNRQHANKKCVFESIDIFCDWE